MEPSRSIFNRFLSRPRPVWVGLFVSVSLLLLPFAAALLDGILGEFLADGRWRAYLLAPAILLYIWLISPAMTRVGNDVLISLRPLIELDDESFDRMVEKASRVDPRHEALAFGVGAIFGVVTALNSGFADNVVWLGVFGVLTQGLMYGLLVWVIYASVANTRLNAALHRQPMRIDIFNPTPFESVGRQSLLLALVFIGGITLSLLFSLQVQNFSSGEFWLTYLALVLVVLLIFFLNMRPTHRLLAQARKDELEPLQQRINASCRVLVERLEGGQEAGSLSDQINALVSYEDRLGRARTWPYNTAMLRTLFFSVFIPLGSILARLLVDVLFP